MKKLLTALSALALLGCLYTPIKTEAVGIPVEELPIEVRTRMKEDGDKSRMERANQSQINGDTRATKKIKITYVSQGSNSYYCGPASVSMVLKTVGKINLSLDSLATKLNTKPSIGTYVTDVERVLNNQLGSGTYELYNVSQGSDLPGDIERSIDEGYPLIYDVLTNSSMPGYSSRISHYIVGNGYTNIYSTSAKITYNDPNGNNSAAKGEQTIKFSVLEKVLEDNEGGYYVASKY